MAKRILDVLLTLAVLPLALPLMALVALVIRWRMGRPVLYREERLGLGARPLRITKFRTMSNDRDADGALLPDADRLSPLGRLLRETSLDELPELFLVLKGEMSLVGPRPEVPRYVEMFHSEFREILAVRPGITDVASIKFRDEEDLLARAKDPEEEYIKRVLPQKIALAKAYVRQRSFWLDASLIASTLLHLAGRGRKSCV